MKEILSQLIDDFHERELPHPVPRNATLAEIRGKADVVIGIRRAGKTWFCYQKMNELLEQGTQKEEILYLNFEDDRLMGFDITHFQDIIDVYYGKYPEFRRGGAIFSSTKSSASTIGSGLSGVCWIRRTSRYISPAPH